MKPTKELVDQLFAERVDAARQMSFEEKFLAGPQLFDYACRIARDGIRMQHPEFSADEVENELNRRLEIERRLEDGV
jgi:hypothetical protein